MDVEPAERQVEEIESLCMNCHENGTTKLLLTRIPFFRDIVVMSFECPECHFKNTEIQSAGEIQQRGVKFTFKLDAADDLQRQIVKSDTCICRVEDIDLEIPAGRGQLTNVEGLLSMIKSDLESQQPARKAVDENLYTQVQAVIDRLGAMAEGASFPITLTVDDPAGNSSIEPSPEDRSGKYIRAEYPRSEEQNTALGLSDTSAQPDTATSAPESIVRPEYRASDQLYPSLPTTNGANAVNTLDENDEIIENQVYTFPTTCPGCTQPTTTNMKMVRIPHFDEVLLMSIHCGACGYRSNEVKTGGAIPARGRRIILTVRNRADLSRDILKGEHCALSVPELALHVEPGTLGGRFTTVEGLLTQVRDDLRSAIFDAGGGGDSMDGGTRARWDAFFAGLSTAIAGDESALPFTLRLEDPLAKSYVQSFTAPEPDEQITMEEYDRTEEEEEDLGLKDMVTEGYGEEAEKERGTDGVDTAEVEREVRERLAQLEKEDS